MKKKNEVIIIDLTVSSDEEDEEEKKQKKPKLKKKIPKEEEEEEDCPICMEELSRDNLFIFEKCSHKICRNCAQSIFKNEIKKKNSNITCPFCRKNVTEIDLYNVLTQEQVQEYKTIENLDCLTNMEGFKKCLTEGCINGVFLYETDFPAFKCQECKKDYCLKCKSEAHGGTCDDWIKFKNDNNVPNATNRELLNWNLVIQCPDCELYIPKPRSNGGTAHCDRCKSNFHWSNRGQHVAHNPDNYEKLRVALRNAQNLQRQVHMNINNNMGFYNPNTYEASKNDRIRNFLHQRELQRRSRINTSFNAPVYPVETVVNQNQRNKRKRRIVKQPIKRRKT